MLPPSPWLVIFDNLPGRGHRERLCETLRLAIHRGHLSAGQKLPSSRQLAADLSLSRVTTEAAYSQLESEGYLVRYQGKGSFVATSVRTINRPLNDPFSLPTLSERGRQIVATGGCEDPRVPAAFAAGSPDLREFPFPAWQKLYDEVLRRQDLKLFGYGDPQDLPELRTVIADYLALSRQVNCTAQQVIILNSSQQALQLISMLLIDPQDQVLTEQACYPGARNAFLAAGAKLSSLTLDDQGAQVPDIAAKLAYLTVAHQYPLGMSMSSTRRKEWLEWAKQHGAWLVEDDYDGEFHYQDTTLPALQSEDRQQRVIYLGTFSKSLFPSLRLAWMVLPVSLTDSMVRARTLTDGHTPQLSQAVTTEFIRRGYFAQHLRRMRKLYGSRRQLLTEQLQQNFGQWLRVMPGDGGLQLTVELLQGEETVLTRQAMAAGLILPPVSPLFISGQKLQGWILGYSALQRAEILEACQRLRALFA
ncbi:GntR family transcriptional regulator [Tatumella morbirosei]|uniref:GntR family transcriptional regulator n=1 Tax=Tatumella morbirosei TaxID=642227 RepID=A0A095VCA4_9GAMM|nr:PLP-dependent aminotransferase family protein [Tatumella morbirosei]KGD72330.1 GntR family transcriptional regulator [Tatumella morbirosei]